MHLQVNIHIIFATNCSWLVVNMMLVVPTPGMLYQGQYMPILLLNKFCCGRHCLPFALCHKVKAGPAHGACTVEYFKSMCKRVSDGAGGVRVGAGRVQRSWLHRLTATPMRTTSGHNWLQVMRTEAAQPKEGTPLASHVPFPVPQLRVAGISGQNMVSSCY